MERTSGIIAHGVDLVEVARIERLLRDHDARFIERVFTPGERAYADANPARRSEILAARFAAKEAVLKAIGTGWSGGIAWTDVEVLRDDAGRPSVRITGEAAIAANARFAGQTVHWLISLSHTGGLAMASAVATRVATMQSTSPD
jgi:holo-[acyl-carrier protein] synthase